MRCFYQTTLIKNKNCHGLGSLKTCRVKKKKKVSLLLVVIAVRPAAGTTRHGPWHERTNERGFVSPRRSQSQELESSKFHREKVEPISHLGRSGRSLVPSFVRLSGRTDERAGEGKLAIKNGTCTRPAKSKFQHT